jgi:hypothetical protein
MSNVVVAQWLTHSRAHHSDALRFWQRTAISSGKLIGGVGMSLRIIVKVEGPEGVLVGSENVAKINPIPPRSHTTTPHHFPVHMKGQKEVFRHRESNPGLVGTLK